MEVNAHFREGRKKQWEARWWVNRKPRSRFFATEKERNKFIREFNKEISQHGSEVFQFNKAVARRWQIVSEILPEVDPVEMAEFWLANHSTKEQRTFSEAIQSYLLEMQKAGRDKEYQKHTLRALDRFAAKHGEKTLADITSQEISEFIHDLPFQALTKNHYRTYLVGAFKWFISQEWIHSNPASTVPAPKVHLVEPGILTIAETESLFRENEKLDPGICGLLALGAFAGMRSSAISRLAWDELDFKNRTILTPASKTKKGRRHFIEDLPDNLWEWLERTPKKAFKMTPRQFSYRREAAFARAGLLVTKAAAKASKGNLNTKAPPKNCLRHSFVSYHVALHRDPGKTALLISHKDQAILWDHYLGVAKREDASRYFSLSPQ
ncbi:MAG: tyrosine-type recombinase/integrase [Puniceicoccaceae bacterium]